MARWLKVGDRVRFRVGGEDLIMTVSAFHPGHNYADLTYTLDREVRRVSIMASALVLVNDAGRPEVESCL